MAILMGHTEEGTGTDHSHASGLIRGRMDFRLNKALGLVEAFADKLTPEELVDLNVTPGLNVASAVLIAMACYMQLPPAVAAIGARYGLIGKAKRKKKMIYGSASGPLPPVKKAKVKK